MRTHFDEKLAALRAAVDALAQSALTGVGVLGAALSAGSTEALAVQAAKVDEIYRQERESEYAALALLLSEQPVARDLLLVSTALKSVTDWSRINVQIADVAAILQRAERELDAESRKRLALMVAAVSRMLEAARQALDADETALLALCAMDDEVDALFESTRVALLAETSSSQENRTLALDVLMVSKYLERIGDHACSIADWVLFARRGVGPQSQRVGHREKEQR